MLEQFKEKRFGAAISVAWAKPHQRQPNAVRVHMSMTYSHVQNIHNYEPKQCFVLIVLKM